MVGLIGPGPYNYGTKFPCCFGRKPNHRDFCPEKPRSVPCNAAIFGGQGEWYCSVHNVGSPAEGCSEVSIPSRYDDAVDIGGGVRISYTSWSPDRALNPQYDGIPDIDRLGIIFRHKCGDNEDGAGSVMFDTPDARKVFDRKLTDLDGSSRQQPFWTVEQEDPLTLSPSILCRECKKHGWICDGRWVEAG